MSTIQEHPKVLFLGALGVGKSAFVRQVMEGKFVENSKFDEWEFHRIELEETFWKTIDLGGEYGEVTMELWDTETHDEFDSMQMEFMRAADCFVLMWRMDDKQSFEDMKKYIEKLERTYDFETAEEFKEIPIVFVENKSDLDVEERQVEAKDAGELAEQYGGWYVRTSVKTGENVMDTLAYLGKRWKQKQLDEERRKGGYKSVFFKKIFG